MERSRNLLLLAILTVATTFVLWLPFLLRLPEFWGIELRRDGMATVVANYDGPYYIVVAKTLYNPQAVVASFSFPLPSIYYSAHYPLFPMLIRGVDTIFSFISYPYAMMAVTIVTSILAVWMFYILARSVGLAKHALWLSIIFLIFPARWLTTRSIGSPEPLFLLLIMASVYFFDKKNWWLAGILGALAQLTKSPAILLFVAYIIAIIAPHWQNLAHTNTSAWIKNLPWRAYPILLIPLTLLGLFAFYGYVYGDFFAYFNSGDNLHLFFPPFQVFNPEATWVGTFWLEEIIWIYLFGALGIVYLIKQKRAAMASFVLIFFVSTLFISHRDLARYSLPIVPFLLIAFNRVIIRPEFKWVVLVLLVPIYLASIVFINNNVTPIGDWQPLL